MLRLLNSQEFCTLSYADLIISSNTVIFCRGCLRIMDMKLTTFAVLVLDAFENLKSPGSSLSSKILNLLVQVSLLTF